MPVCRVNILQSPAESRPASVGDDACIVPQTLQCRKPQAAGEIARPTLRPGPGGDRYAPAFRQARWRADEIIGPYAGVAAGGGGMRRPAPRLCRPYALHCRAGVHARRGACANPEGYWHGKVPHPSVAWGDTSPCRGGFIAGSPPKASPARGGGCAARRRRRGALPLCPTGILQPPAGLCPMFRRDDLRAKSRHFTLCAPKRRLRAAVLASSRKPCNAANPGRRAKSPALHCGREQAATDTRQPSARPTNGPMKSSAPTQALRPAGGRPGFRRLYAPHCGREREITLKRQPSAGSGGPMQASDPTKGRLASAHAAADMRRPPRRPCRQHQTPPPTTPPPTTPPQNRKDPPCRKKKTTIPPPAWPRR